MSKPGPVGLEYWILALTCGSAGARSGLCSDLVLAGEPAEDRFAAYLVVGEVDHAWGLSFGLERCELSECAVWSCGVEVVQVGGEDAVEVAFVDD